MNQDSTMETEIDTIINEVNQEEVAEEVVENPESETEEETVDNDETTEESNGEETEVEDIPFPKKAVNALSRRDKKISKQASELQELRQQLEQLQQAQQTPQTSDKEPIEDDYESYGKFLQAHARYVVKEEMKALNPQGNQEQQLTPEQAQQQEWYETQTTSVAERSEVLKAEIPDFDEVVTTNADILDDLSPEQEMLFLSVEDPSLAFYNLAKAGRLEEVLNKPTQFLAIELQNASKQGYAKPKTVTKAPKPIKGSNGSGSGKKDPEDMSGDELMKWIHS